MMKETAKRFTIWAMALALVFTTAVPAFGQIRGPSGDIEAYAISGENVIGPEGASDQGKMTLSEAAGDTGYENEDSYGWQTIDGKKYYIDEWTGKPVVGAQKIGQKYYCFKQNGELANSGWVTVYGFKWYVKDGVIQTGLKTIKGSKYYFEPTKNESYTLDNGVEIYIYGIMCNGGLYKKYIIAYNGKLFKIPSAKKDKKCKKIAKLIARCSGKGVKGMSDLQKVQQASYTIYAFYGRCKYSMKAKNYNKPYGVFYSKKCSCAGTARAMGLVLKYMGFKYKHVNKNKYKHQWCSLKMDGKKGWADGMIGGADYGKHPAAK